MKVFVLTHCAAEENYTPEVFTNKEKAIERMKDLYEDCLFEGDYVATDELYEHCAEVVYIDDTYDRFDIFEVELREK